MDSTGAATKEDGGQGSAPAMGTIGGPDDDLTLRASLYGVLFQSYADKVFPNVYFYICIFFIELV